MNWWDGKGKWKNRIPSLITEDIICQQVIRTSQMDKWYEPLYLSTEDFAKSGRISLNFLLQKRKISILHIFLYSFSCKMIYSLSFCFAILIRYRTISIDKPYFSTRYHIVILSSFRK